MVKPLTDSELKRLIARKVVSLPEKRARNRKRRAKYLEKSGDYDRQYRRDYMRKRRAEERRKRGADQYEI